MQYDGGRGGEGGGRERDEGYIKRGKKKRGEGLQETTEQSEPWRWMGRENMNERRERVFF